MSLSDYQKCPGPERSVAAVPEDHPCPGCGHPVEIWTDEKKRTCPDCGTCLYRPMLATNAANHEQDRWEQKMKQDIKQLVQWAIQQGASDAAMIPSMEISAEEDLASLCGGDPPCENLGLSPSCPPHVSGPAGFRKWREKSRYAIVVRIDIPSMVMYSTERRDVMQLLHETVAGVEQRAAGMGYIGSRSFAGGSCKKIFCHGHPGCRVLLGQGECRNPHIARPSMSGFGINVAKLMQSAGWSLKKITHENTWDTESMTWVAGLILVAET